MLRVLLSVALAFCVAVGTAEAKPGGGKGGHKAAGAAKAKKAPEDVFKAKDKNGDNKLSQDEFVGNPKKAELKDKLLQQFKAKDKDGDGSLSLAEFTAKKGKGAGGKKHKKNK